MPSRREEKTFIYQGESGVRVDKAAVAEGIQRTLFSFFDTTIMVNGKKAKKSILLNPGDSVTVCFTEQYFDGVKPEELPLNVLYEDNDVLVINKEQGMVVHPAVGNWDGTLVNALLGRYGTEFSEDEEDTLRPGIVHRLDKDTSGTMVIARNKQAMENLSSQFGAHSTEKIYICVVKGRFSEIKGTIITGIIRNPKDRKKFMTCPEGEGRYAHTEYQVLRQGDDCALVRVHIFTGRTHQIRVHLLSIGHPIVGDPIYGSGKDGTTLLLHAFSLSFDHPTTGKRMTFRSPLPSRFLEYLTPRLARRNASVRSSQA